MLYSDSIITLHAKYFTYIQGIKLSVSQSVKRDLYDTELNAIRLLENYLASTNKDFTYQSVTNDFIFEFKKYLIGVLDYVYENTGVQIHLDDSALHI